MKTKFNLELNNPCSENFNNFQKTEKGGFCSSCQKEVVDFTTMTSKEILTYFKNNQGNKTCGKFAKHQLEHTYQDFQQPKSYNLFRAFGLAVVSLFSFNTVQAQETKPTTEITPKTSEHEINNQDSFTVKGVVSDEVGPLPEANVVFKGKMRGILTNFDGEFELSGLKKGDVLVFSYLGMECKEVVINGSSTLNVILAEDKNYFSLGEVQTKKVFNSKKRKGFWGK